MEDESGILLREQLWTFRMTHNAVDRGSSGTCGNRGVTRLSLSNSTREGHGACSGSKRSVDVGERAGDRRTDARMHRNRREVKGRVAGSVFGIIRILDP